ncbi:hypothetical protein [Streptococcus dentiloxodontae]
MNSVMKNTAASIGEALAEGAVIVPNIIFAGLLYQHYGYYQFLLPFVLLYSFEKAGVFVIQGFGRLKNPYKVLRYSILLAILGTCLCLFGDFSFVFWEIGAVLVGLGLANYNALFKTIKSILKEKNEWVYKGSLIKAYFILGITILLFLSFRHTSITLVFALFLLLLVISYSFIYQLEQESRFNQQAPFERKRDSWRHFIPAICMLLFSFFTRLLKQTANTDYALYIGLALCLFIVVSLLFRSLHFSLQALFTLWFGAARNFLVIYSLIYFIAIDKLYMVGFAYAMLVLGLMLSMTIRKKLQQIVGKSYFVITCLLASMASFLLLLSPVTYLLGILLSSTFIASGNHFVLQKFTKDERLPFLERRIIRSKFYGLGAIMQQVVLLLTLIVVSWSQNHKSALSAYALSSNSKNIEGVFFYTRIICLAFIGITALGLVLINKRKKF